MDQDKKVKFNFTKLKAIPIYLLCCYFLFIGVTYLKAGPITSVKFWTFFGYLGVWLFISFLCLVESTVVRSFLTKHRRWVNALVLTISPLVSFLMVEIMVSNINVKMFKAYSLYNIIWYIIVYYLIYSLLRNSGLTVIIGNLMIYLLATLNYLVFLFRGNPLLPSDLLAWQTGVSVASNYELSFTKNFLVATIMMFFMLALGFKLAKSEKKPSVINRVVVIVTFVLLVTIVFHEFFGTDLIKTKIRVIDFFAPKYTYSDYGTAFGFIANVQAMETKAPDGYSIKVVDDALSKAAGASQGNGEVTSEVKPNIIVIMNEAFSDLSLVGDYKTNIDYLPFIKSLQENTIKGTLYVSIFGGGTSDTEYEFLTGNSMAVMPSNCVPYQQFVTDPSPSLATTLKAQGYYNIAIHPYEPSGYKRDLVYPLLGFDEFLSMKDFKNPKTIRSFISDESSYGKIIEEYEAKGDQGPLFIFNVTMQNHGGYSSTQLFPDAESVKLTDHPRVAKTEQYLSLLRKSDQAFKTLTDYFSQQKEPTIILLYGDHQPAVYADLYNEMADQTKVVQLKYQVPFIMWANYDIPKDDVDKMSANYLSSYLLKTAGLQGTAYNDYLMKLYEEVPVINSQFYIDKEDMFHGFNDTTKDYDLIQEYKSVGYNNALDSKDKLTKYYYLQ